MNRHFAISRETRFPGIVPRTAAARTPRGPKLAPDSPPRLARPTGLEPATVGLEGRCSIRLSYGRIDSRIVTGSGAATPHRSRLPHEQMVGVEGFEPPTSCSQSRRATRLRYTPFSPSPRHAGREKRIDDGTKQRPSRQSGNLAMPFPRTATAGLLQKQKGCRSTLRVQVARPERFELPTTKFVAWCSIQLSYGRIATCVPSPNDGRLA